MTKENISAILNDEAVTPPNYVAQTPTVWDAERHSTTSLTSSDGTLGSSLIVSGRYEFSFDNLSFSVPVKGKEPKEIIRNVSGKITSGDMMALMGPSGAGKSTLLNILTHKAFKGRANGSIELNGKDFSYSMFKEHCGFVDQHDTLWSQLTPLEHLKYAANLALSTVTQEEKETIIDNLLDLMGLTQAGSTKASRLSGGQKRRLSLAIAMLKSPKLLILDEPTSGLDASSAASVVEAMATLAFETRVMIICTIHQPSIEVFSAFSHTILLARGQTVYCGYRDAIISYFEASGYPCPENMNPADHLLHITNCEFTDAEKVQGLIDAWGNQNSTVALPPAKFTALISHNKGKFRILPQTGVLLKRHFWLSLLDPTIYWGRAVFFFLTGVLIATVYIYTRDRTLDLAVERVTMEGWFFAVPSLLSIVHVYQTSLEMNVIAHEVRLGYVNPIAYISTKTIIEIPFMFILALSTIGVGGFAMLDFNAENFGPIFLTFTFILLAFEALAQVIAVAIRSTTVAMLCYVLVWFGAFLFSDIWIGSESVILPFRLLFYVSPFRLAFKAFLYLDFKGTYFSCGDGVSIFSSSYECLGAFSGDKVLDLIGTVVFPVAEPSVDVSWCIGSTLVIVIAFKTLYAFVLILSSSHHSRISSSRSSGNRRCVALKLWSAIAIAIAATITGTSLWVAHDEDDIGSKECYAALQSSRFNFMNFADYDKFFDENSTMILAEAGEYKGPENILEYVLFLFASPYLKGRILREDIYFKGYDSGTNACIFRHVGLQEFVPDGTNADGDVNIFQVAVMTKFDIDYFTHTVSKVNVFYSKEFLTFFFGNLLGSNATRRFVCSVVNGPCGMQEDDCESRLAALPISTGDTSVTGKSQGCRALHAAFASVNTEHCPHLSFEPKPDINGKIKCQDTLDITPMDLFDEEDLNAFADFNREMGMDEKSGFVESTTEGTPNVCKQQENYIRDINISSHGQKKLDHLYNLDFNEYSTEPKNFLRFRSKLCGKNFASLGKVIIGRHKEVVQLLALENQIRGQFYGPARLQKTRVNFPFLVSMSDSDSYDNLRTSFISRIILPAQENAQDNAALDSLVDNLINDLEIGSSSPTYRRNVIDAFAQRWIMRAVFDMDVQGGVAEVLLQFLFRGDPQHNYLAGIMEPLASRVVSDEQAKDLQDDFHRLGALIKTAAVMDDYEYWGASLNMTKTSYSDQLTGLVGIAGLNEIVPMLENLFSNIPADVLDSIDYDDPDEIENVVLESLRLNAAFQYVNVILPEDTTLNVGGEEKMFPKGTPIASSLPLANWDEEVFPDPFVFNHIRENLKEDIVSFGIRGYDSASFPRRSCPGKNLAMKVGKDVLMAWLKSRNLHNGEDEL